MKIVFVFALILFLFVTFVDLRKKKKEVKAKKPKKTKKDLIPPHISEHLYCDACIAIVTEAQKKLFGKKSESDIVEVIENICDPELYYTYSNSSVYFRSSSS